MKIKTHLVITFICLVVVLLAEQFSGADIRLQNLFFNFSSCSWLISRQNNYVLHFFLYSGVKVALIVAAVGALVAFGLSFKYAKLKTKRYTLLMFISAMLFVPLILAGAKKYTNVYCPAQLTTYCGSKPYAKLFASYPADFDRKANSKGRCFPAGHASGGFALMVLFFCFKRRRNKISGLGAGLALGWSMGLYQMLRGEHFLSHTLTSMFGAWFIILLLWLVFEKLKSKYPAFFPAD